MRSINFEFLRDTYPELADLGAFAEMYAHSDPASSKVKSRILAENIAKLLCNKFRITLYDDNFLTMLRELANRNILPKVILDFFHHVRIQGNEAAHSSQNNEGQAIQTLKSVFDLTRWWIKFQNPVTAIPSCFQDIPRSSQPTKRQNEEQDEQLAQLAKRLLAENIELRKNLSDLTSQKAEQFAGQAAQAADALKFDEATTRKRLIDSMLVSAGWDIADSDEVWQEQILKLPNTPSANGRADYVLYDDDGTALAVIEAKRTSVSPSVGRAEAKRYADTLQAKDPDHVRPLIILSNGYESLLVDDKGGPKSLPVSGYADRKIFGIPAKDSLRYRVRYQRNTMLDPATIAHRADIAGGYRREYQLEAIKAVAERFGEQRRRKALIVQATGTGKTRVAVAIAELLNRANFVKRVLFLCDRNELRRQAKNAFSQFLPDWNVEILGSPDEKNAQVLLATYPGMMGRFRDFDIAWFDLVIADESHRSIYNKYRDLFLYFDALQLGLTATPVNMIARNTFKMFGCDKDKPTYLYEYERAIAEGTLVDFVPIDVTTRFMRDGIHYDQLSDEEKCQLEEDGLDDLDVDATELDGQTFNKDTNRKILRNLMENGLRDKTGNGPGKSIIFARNHNHAMLLQELFQEMYPQFGSDYCVVIDNYIVDNEQLLDNFKELGKNPVIAISVDMLDTGIDVPEILNLVFAKPVKSYVKFWQMIGRGTRLCGNLHGSGQDKKCFYLFDHWGNCEYFDMGKGKKEAEPSASLVERLFDSRLALAQTALEKRLQQGFDVALPLVRNMINSLPDTSLPVREKYRQKLHALTGNVLEQFDPATVTMLRRELMPLMRYVSIKGHGEKAALDFDLLIADLQTNLLQQSSHVEGLRNRLDNSLSCLPGSIMAVRAKFTEIKELQDKSFWQKPLEELVPALEEKRVSLRGLMQYLPSNQYDPQPPLVIDVSDGDVHYEVRKPLRPSAEEMRAYKDELRQVLESHFETDATLKKLRRGEAFTDADFEKLASLVLTQDAGVSLDLLKEFYPATHELEKELRSLIGMNAETVRERFAIFFQKYPALSSRQTQFLNLLQKQIQKCGPIRMEHLYQAPFTNMSSAGPDGIFTDDQQISDLSFVLHSLIQQRSSI